MDFVAFDFETANSRSDSACQLAAVKVLNGQITAEFSWLIRPPQLYFSRRNISIHGIRPDHVSASPTMEKVWPEFAEFAEGFLLVAHNANFDMGVLVSSLAAFELACPPLEYSCTRALARRAWPGQTSYGLKPLGNRLGISFKHHDALEDSRCCAHIALRIAKEFDASHFAELESRLRLTRGRYNLGRLQGPRAIGRTIAHRSQGLLWRSATDDAAPTPSATLNRTVNAHANSRNNPVHPWRTRSAGRGQIDAGAILTASSNSLPLANKKIVCLGALRGLSVDETRKLIEQLGATWCTAIQPGVHYVIACGGLLMDDAARQVRESIALADNPSEEHDATDVPPSISHLRVLSERQFLALIPGGKSAVSW